MKNKKTTRLVLIIASIVLTLIAVISTTQAYFSDDVYANNPTEYQTGILSIEAVSKSNNISLENTLPMSDTDGLTTTPYVFTIKNNGNVDYKFDVKLLATNDNTFDSQYIKLQIDNEGVSTLSSLTNSIIKKDVILYSGQTIDISVRIWLSENTKNTQIGKTFNSKIVIDGQSIYTQTNTDIVTSLEDFDYYLGSDYEDGISTIKVYDEEDGQYYDGTLYEPIPLNSNEVLLTKYKGKSKNVVVPDTYIVGDIVYNVVLLSSYYCETTNNEYWDGIFSGNKIIESVYLDNNIKIVVNNDEIDYVENDAQYLFSGCTSLINAPEIPSSVTDMSFTFYNCKSLINAPEIPSSVTNMDSTFRECTSLVNAPEIPSTVTNMYGTFYGCTNLTGTVKINSSSVLSVSNIFDGTTKNITVQVPSGSTTYTKLNALTTSNGMPANVTLTTFTS